MSSSLPADPASRSDRGATERGAPRLAVPVALILLVAAGLRLPGLWTDFWLDEIWTWGLAVQVQQPWEIITAIHADNNNHLNTLWLWICGPAAPLWLYRIHSFAAGLVTVGCAIALAARWSRGQRVAVLAAGLVAATSAVFVIYASEARGYSMAMAAAVGGQWVLGRAVRDNRRRDWFLAVVVALTGFLSHLSYLPVWLAQVAWIALEWLAAAGWGGRWLRTLSGTAESGPRASRWRVQPLVAVGAVGCGVLLLYLVDLRLAGVGGGPELDPLIVSLDTLAEPFGAVDGAAKVVAALATLTLLVCGIGSAFRHTCGSRLEMVVPAAVLVIAPIVLFGMAPAGLVYPRHFLVSLSLALPVLGVGWVALVRQAGLARFVAVAILVFWMVGNGLALAGFFRDGRGGYTRALRDLATDRPVGTVVLGSDHDFRNGMIIGFQRLRHPEFSRFEYRPQGQWPVEGVDSLILHDLAVTPSFADRLDVGGKAYHLVKTYRFSGPVGWHWATYRRGGGE